MDLHGGVDFGLGEELAGGEFEDVEAARDFRAVDVAVVPVGGPVATVGVLDGVEGAAVEVGDLEGLPGVGVVHDGDAALVPGLDLDVASGDGDEGAVVGGAVFQLGLGCGHLVVAVEGEGVVFKGEDGIGSPGHGVGWTAAGLGSSAPFVGEDDAVAGVVEHRRVPEREVGVGDGGDALGVNGVLDVEEDADAGAGPGGEAEGGVDGDVVASADGLGGCAFAVQIADGEAVHGPSGFVGEDAGAVDDLGEFGVGEGDLDDDNGVKGGVGVVEAAAGAAGELFGLADGGIAGDVEVDVVLVLGVYEEGVGVGAAAGLDSGELLGIAEVGDVEDADSAEAVFAWRGRWGAAESGGGACWGVGGWRGWGGGDIAGGERNALGAAIDAAADGFNRHEEEVAVDGDVALAAGAHDGGGELRLLGVGDVVEVEAVVVADEDVVAAEGEVGVGGAE